MKQFLYFFSLLLLSFSSGKAQTCLNVAVNFNSEVTCFGAADGSATAVTTDGTPPYTYIWDIGVVTATVNNLSVGDYFVTVTDALACSGTASVFVSEPSLLEVMVDSIIPVSCFGASNGQATVWGVGGVPPYFYQWDNGEASQTALNLSAGFHTVTVFDGNGCSTSADVIIADAPPSISVIVSEMDDLCFQSCDGGASANVTGGTPPYSYLWSTGENTASIVGLCAGTYSVSVMDGFGCTSNAIFTIEQVDELTAIVDVTGGTCQGGYGQINIVNTTGGIPPYIYSLDGISFQTGSIYAGLLSGSYQLFIQDAVGCEVTLPILVSDSLINIDIVSTNTSCDMADGTASVSVNLPNPTYAWSNGESTATVTGLAPGWYSVTVENQTGTCRTHRNFLIEENITCNVVINGYVYNDEAMGDCFIDSGTSPFIYKALFLKDGGQVLATTFTDANGYYEFTVDDGVYELELVTSSSDSLFCPASPVVSINAPTTGAVYSQDFFLGFRDIKDLSVNLAKGAARPGFTQWYSLYYCNYGNDTTDAVITFQHDSLLVNFNANSSEDSYDASTYTATWNLYDIAPGECGSIPFNLDVPVSTPLGTLLTSNTVISPIQNDETPENNEVTCHTVVTGSYDPNDKQNLSASNPFGGDISPDIETYTYQIRFQNTGTDTAFTVVIKDELDANFFDLTTIRPIASSHDFTMDMEGNNTLVFFFEDIMLPDSNVNLAASNGHVYFTIDKLPNLPLGTQVSNEAAIYFDFNAPVITNMVTNTLAVPTKITNYQQLDFDFNVFPNPLQEEAFLEINSKSNEVFTIEILDVQGRLWKKLRVEERLNAGQHLIPLNYEEWPTGVYFVRVQTRENSLIKKVIRIE